MKVKAPAEDPAEKAARLAEATRADDALTSSTQDLLDEEDRQRLRRLGALPNATAGATAGAIPLTVGAAGVMPAGVAPAGGGAAAGGAGNSGVGANGGGAVRPF